MIDIKELLTGVRSFLLRKSNREFFLFLFFFALSGLFWLFMTLDETYEREIAVPITITNIPGNVVLTSAEKDTVRVTVRDKGIILATYMFGDVLKPVTVNFNAYNHGNGSGSITAAELQRMILLQLASGSRITSVKPERLEYTYNYGAKKRVRVRWSGRVIPEQLYFISQVRYWPDSVTVYASDRLFDSITSVSTEPLNYANFRDTLIVDCRLARIKGVKMVPDQVKVGFFTDLLTEESIENIPIEGINVPEGKSLRTFPARVKVNFVTGVNVFRSLKASDFRVVADYKKLQSNPSEKCHIYLASSPPGISKVRLETEEVDYLIEELDR